MYVIWNQFLIDSSILSGPGFFLWSQNMNPDRVIRIIYYITISLNSRFQLDLSINRTFQVKFINIPLTFSFWILYTHWEWFHEGCSILL